MKKVICCPTASIPDVLDPEALYFILYSTSSSTNPDIGHITPTLLNDIKRKGLNPSIEAMDFTTFALSVAAADEAIIRSQSADGWTRTIELYIYLQQPTAWRSKRNELELTLRFLTGDFWSLHFLDSEPIKLHPNRRAEIDPADCVCLLSGGVDSLIGAIDLTSMGKKPFFVSKIVRGDRDTQNKFAVELGGENRHCQWSGTIKHHGTTEPSTRARSIVFFAYALLAASAIPSTSEEPVEIYVPENGFISLNMPLGPMRAGSLSTKTTHPIYISGLQSMWDTLGLNVKLIQPYKFKTKGEMIYECLNRETLISLINDSVSCGKYRRYKLTHCGVCVPCLVRRAAFLKASMADLTLKGYYYEQISHADSRDVSSVASTYLKYQSEGIKSMTCGNLSFASSSERNQYENVIANGLDELGTLLSNQGVI